MDKSHGKPSSNKIINWDKQEVALGKGNDQRAGCPKNKLKFKFIIEPGCLQEGRKILIIEGRTTFC